MSEKANLIKGLFLTTPDELLATADVYAKGGIGSSVINSIQSFASKSGIDLSAIARGGQAVSKLLPSIISSAKALSSGDLLTRISAAGNLSAMAMKGLPTGIQDQITKLYTDYGDTIMTVADVSQRVYATDFKNLNDVAGLINNLAGKGTVLFQDQDGLAALSLGVMQEATKYGIPNSFEALAKNITDSDLLMKVANGAVPFAVTSGDVRMLGSIADAMGSGNLASAVPGVLNDFATNYSNEMSFVVADALGAYEQVRSAFDSVDSNWLTSFRMDGTEQVLSSSTLQKASDDFQSLFKTGALESDDLDLKLLMATTELGIETVDQSIYRELPFFIPRFALG